MIGLGETFSEIKNLMDDLRFNDVDFITIGQYLRPSKNHHPVIEYHKPEYFNKLYEEAMSRGFKNSFFLTIYSFFFSRKQRL